MVFVVAGPQTADLSTSIGIERMRKFQRSLGRYGPGAFLYTLYGIADIPQGFARLCAIFGGTFVLRHAVQAIVTAPADWNPPAEPEKKDESSEKSLTPEDSSASVSSHSDQTVSTSPAPLFFEGNGRRFRGVLSAGGQLLTANCLVTDPEYVPNYVESSSTICRCAILSDRPLNLQANAVSDSCAMFVIYPNTFGNRSAVRMLQFDSTSSMCGADTYLIHMSVACNAPEDLRRIVDTLFVAISNAEQPEAPSSGDVVIVDSTDSADPRPRILWRASWSQTCRRAHSNDRVPSNVFVCSDPDHELGFTAAVQKVCCFYVFI
jgi:RAB protein geranylgeranyltransferase component A